jgi:hypothetical protein
MNQVLETLQALPPDVNVGLLSHAVRILTSVPSVTTIF